MPAQDDHQSRSRTLSADEFAPDAAHRQPAATVGLDRAPAFAREQDLILAQRSLADDLAREAGTSSAPTSPRFDVEGLLGNGATGYVYAVLDNDLARSVAVKVLARPDGPDDVGRFVEEARITASLQHPNVLPVYEIDVNERGDVYFVMKRVQGQSLGEALSTSSRDALAPRISATNAVVNIFIGIANALACAHAAGIIHQDIKPDNIMLGQFGEALLVDWGSAVRGRASETRLYGTPLYMAPEQARREFADARSDLYCLGATLFHALMLRPPTWSDDSVEFWRRKQSGEIDALTDAERASVPAPVLAIAIKAMAAQPEARYQSATELIADLERYQAGLAVSAHRETWLEVIARWHRRHGKILWITASAAAAILVLGVMLYGERLKEVASWGRPIIVEEFDNDSWKQQWTVTAGEGSVTDGRFVSQGELHTILTFNKALHGDVAIEFEGEMLKGHYPCDLSIMITPEPNTGIHASDLAMVTANDRGVMQVGANSGSFCRIINRDGAVGAFNPWKPEIGHRYLIRGELVGNRWTLSVDGRRLCEYTDLYPFSGGYLSLYLYYSGKAVDHLRIYSRGLAERLPATAIGDFCVQRGDFAAAIEQYQRVADGSGSESQRDEASYKQGNALLRSGNQEQAFAAWNAIRSTPWTWLVEMHRLDQAFERGDYDRVLAGVPPLFARCDRATRDRVASRVAAQIKTLTVTFVKKGEPEILERFIRLHDQVMTDTQVADAETANALIELGHHEEVIRRFPGYPIQVSEALNHLGRFEEVLDRYADKPDIAVNVLHLMGRGDEISQRYPLRGDPYVWSLVERGLLDEAAALDPGNTFIMYRQGRVEEVAKTGDFEAIMTLGGVDALPEKARTYFKYLLETKQFDAALARDGHDMRIGWYVRATCALARWIAGDNKGADTLWHMDPAQELATRFPHLMYYLVIPFLHETAGDAQAIPRMRARLEEPDRKWAYAQKPRFALRFICGEIDDAGLLAQPYRATAGADLLLCQAIAGERSGRQDDALRAYRALQALPPWQQPFGIDPFMDMFVRWRIGRLAP
ncbi:MAG: serine/threonine protein kinase [Planctomycetes bacterium]|nr:serine/threonine protein kinase [Planctomycetota bacterium]